MRPGSNDHISEIANPLKVVRLLFLVLNLSVNLVFGSTNYASLNNGKRSESQTRVSNGGGRKVQVNRPRVFTGGFSIVKSNQPELSSNSEIYVGNYSSGDDINLNLLQTFNVNLVVFTSATNLTKVEIVYGNKTRTERGAPYALAANVKNNYTAVPWLKVPGIKTITVRGYYGTIVHEELVLTFRMVNAVTMRPVVSPLPVKNPTLRPTIKPVSNSVLAPTHDFLVNGRWRITNMNASIEARHEACFVMAGRKAVLIGGRGKRRPNIYDPMTKNWTTGTLPPGEIGLNHFQCISIKRKVWVIAAFTGGFPNEKNAPFTYIYDPVADKWETQDPMPLDRRRGSAAVVAVGDLIYISHGNIGGHETDNHAVSLGWLDVYNTTSKEWKVLPDASYPRDHTGGALVNGKICVGGGRDGGTIGWPEVPQTECYDIATNKWSLSANVLQMRAGAAYGTSCDGKLLMAGGEGFGKAWTQFDMFDGTKWTRLADLNIGRHGSGLAVDCVCNAIYIASGNAKPGGGMEVTSVETFSVTDAPCLA